MGNTVPRSERRSYGLEVAEPLESGPSIREVASKAWDGCAVTPEAQGSVQGRLLGGGEALAGSPRAGGREGESPGERKDMSKD